MRIRRIAILLIAINALNHWAEAQTVYKCGSTYSQTPCPDARILPVDDGRSVAQQQQTTAASQRDQLRADQLEKTRLEQENTSARPSPAVKATSPKKAGRGPATPAKPMTPAVSRPSATPITRLAKKPQQFVAEVPGSGTSAAEPKKPTVKKTLDK